MSGIKELEEFLAKHIAEGVPGMKRSADYLKADVRQQVISRIARTKAPGIRIPRDIGPEGAAMMKAAESERESALQRYLHGPDLTAAARKPHREAFEMQRDLLYSKPKRKKRSED